MLNLLRRLPRHQHQSHRNQAHGYGHSQPQVRQGRPQRHRSPPSRQGSLRPIKYSPFYVGSPHIPERKGTRLSLFYLFEYGAYYDGDWKNGLPHGAGRLIYDDGSLYEGCFRDGLAECRKALFIRENGTYYKGEVRNNKAFGEGVLTGEKVTYKGKWDNDLPQGEGQ